LKAPANSLCTPYKDGTPIKVKIAQHGATSKNFLPNTSTVVWPVAVRLCNWLCAHNDEIENKSVCELGSGTGLVGLAAAQMRPEKVLLTDASIGILTLNCEGSIAEAAVLMWGDKHTFGTFDVVLMSDVICHQDDDTMAALVNCMLSVSHKGSLHLLAYEHREDWFTMGKFLDLVESSGFSCETECLDDDDDDYVLYKMRYEVD